ncbi:MAG: thioredoxin family protein [Promethearchaeota archaeon]
MRGKVKIVLKEDGENVCAKCCKTQMVIERMLEAIPELKKSFNFEYETLSEEEITKKYGGLIPPAIYINDELYIEGHVPIIKKLSRTLLNLKKERN